MLPGGIIRLRELLFGGGECYWVSTALCIGVSAIEGGPPEAFCDPIFLKCAL